MKRFLAIMIAAILVVSVLPTAFAAEPSEGGYKYNLTTDSLTSKTETKNGSLAGISWEGESPAVITDEDEPGFATTGRNYNRDINPGIYTGGFASGLQVGKMKNDVFTDYFQSVNDDPIGTRAFCLIKINVPVGGKYMFTTLNSFTALPSVFGGYTIDENGTVVAGAVPTVHLIKATKELTYAHATNKTVSNVADLGFSEDTVIGSYDSRKLATDASVPVRTDIGEVELDAGVYYVLFDLDSKALTENTKYWTHNNGNTFQLFLLSGIELTPVAEEDDTEVDPGNATEEELANTTSYVKFLCGADESTLKTEDVAAGTDITCTAPDKEGYTFLYWAQGIGTYKKIVSYGKEISLKAEKGAMWLTAVYSDDSSTKTEVVFYNANGDEISRSQYEQDEVITLKDLPSMAGFGSAMGWKLDTDEKTYTAEDEVKASGKLMRFVAAYADEPTESFAITVADGTADNETPMYGEIVTVTADSTKGEENFNYWQKDGEIVSFDLSYSFKVYKDTTVTAVYSDKPSVANTVRKIIIGTRAVGTETAVVAEFIGISDAVEKGILFGTSLDDATHKISMKTDGDTLSVIDDVAGDAVGYAILSNGNAIYSK